MIELSLGVAQPVISDPKRHAVACATACRGMSTEQLEALVTSGDVLQPRAYYKRQRDVLLAACKLAQDEADAAWDGVYRSTILSDAIAACEMSE